MYPHAADPASGTFVHHQVEQLRQLGHQVDVVHIRGSVSRLNYLKAWLYVFQKTWKRNYNIVHAHYGLSGLSALFRWRTPLVVTLHGSDVLVGRLQPLISRFVCQFAKAVIVVSEQIKAKIHGIVIPCGVDLNVFRPYDQTLARSRLGLPPNRRLILFPFDPERTIKRHNIAKAVVEAVRSRGHDAELLVVSGRPNDTMPWYYSAADAMILCSESEGSPTSVKEALACNTPVVATNVGDVNSILRSPNCGKICDGSVSALAEGLDEILRQGRDPQREPRSTMLRYDLRFTVQSVLSVYQAVLVSHRNVQESTRAA